MPKHEFMPTIRDVAARAGVAPMTVSRVINNSGYVGDETRQRVEQAIAELGYQPNSLARGLRGGQTKTVGLVVSDVTNPFFTIVARGVEDAASAAGFSVFLCNTDESSAKQARYVDALLQKQVDGFLLVPTVRTASAKHSHDIDQILAAGSAVVVMDRLVSNPSVDVIRCDSEISTVKLITHLIQLGHRHIAMLSGPQGVSTADERVYGYERALQDAGLPLNRDYIVYGDYVQQSGYERTNFILELKPRPTALFAANSFIAIGVLRALRDAGLNVPNDFSVVSFDDPPQNCVLDPFLTTASQPGYEMGRRAMEILLERLSGRLPDDAIYEVLTTKVTFRSSTGLALNVDDYGSA